MAHNIYPEKGWKQKGHMSDEVFTSTISHKKLRDDPDKRVIRT